MQIYTVWFNPGHAQKIAFPPDTLHVGDSLQIAGQGHAYPITKIDDATREIELSNCKRPRPPTPPMHSGEGNVAPSQIIIFYFDPSRTTGQQLIHQTRWSSIDFHTVRQAKETVGLRFNGKHYRSGAITWIIRGERCFQANVQLVLVSEADQTFRPIVERPPVGVYEHQLYDDYGNFYAEPDTTQLATVMPGSQRPAFANNMSLPGMPTPPTTPGNSSPRTSSPHTPNPSRWHRRDRSSSYIPVTPPRRRRRFLVKDPKTVVGHFCNALAAGKH